MVKMVLGSSDTQGQTMSSVGKARVTAYNSAVTALSNFNGAGDLQGSAYDSGKKYGVSVITPLIKGAIMYSEYLSEAVPKLPSKYRSEVGNEDLDSAVLESEIQSLESSISGIRGTFRAMEGSDHADRNVLKSISDRMDTLTSQKNEKMDKLRKLNLFAGSSNEVFEGDAKKSMDTVVKNLSAGLNMIQGDFASFGGTFPKHSGKTLNWAKSIEGEWDKKAKIDEDYQKVLEKVNQGKDLTEDDVKALEAYQKRYGRDLPDNVNSAMKKYVEKETEEIAKMISDTLEAYKRGEISEEAINGVFNFLQKNGINISPNDLKKTSIEFLIESLKSKLSDKASDLGAEYYTSYMLPYQVPYLINGLKSQIGKTLTKYGLSALLSTAPGSIANKMVGESIEKVGDAVIPLVNKLSGFLGDAKFAKALPFGIGAALDFAGQLFEGKHPGEALIKTGAHVGIGIGSAKIGATIGTFFGGPLGTAIGAGIGFGLGVAGSRLFDKVYEDNIEKVEKWVGETYEGTKKNVKKFVDSVGDTAGKIWDSAGDAVNGFFSGLGSVF